MKTKLKLSVHNNHTLDKYLRPLQPEQQRDKGKKGIIRIRVPPSSGLPPLHLVQNPILRYPLLPEFREYQQQIVVSCICYNTLVCLPTGLGKTLIAAVVMANFSRWFPQQKIIFMAPTRPLVRQQVTALRDLSDQVHQSKIIEVNGELASQKRQQLYQKYQIIFATPQTIQNDLKSGRLLGKQIILMVVDQCHRTVGNSSYSQVIRYMNEQEVGFRVVGLSATPGSETEKIQQVVYNLNIKKIVYKDDQDPDVKKYLHEKTIHEIEIQQTSIIKEALTILEKFAKPSLGLLVKYKLVDPWLVKNGIAGSFFLIREKFTVYIKDLPIKLKPLAYSAFKILNFLFACRKCLLQQGYQTFKTKFFGGINPLQQKKIHKRKSLSQDDQEETVKGEVQEETYVTQFSEMNSQNSLQTVFDFYEQSWNRAKEQKSKTNLPPNFRNSVMELKQYQHLYTIFHQGQGKSMHPKLIKLAQILKNFFDRKTGKVIVFTQFRISAKQIKQYLEGIQSIKSQLFFGQSKTMLNEEDQNGSSCFLQLKQKDQLQVINKYKKGIINTLISTCIGEQGLDIGEVDCIVCYDGGHSPIRAIQRRGRTGRKRSGEVYILMMQGKQKQAYKKGSKKQTKMKEILKKNVHKFSYYPYNSSLFEDNSYIPIQLYENTIAEHKSSKKQTKKQKEVDDKPTKKAKRGSKGKKLPVTKEETSEAEIENPCQQIIQFKITTMDCLLQRYKTDETEIELGQILLDDHKSQNKIGQNSDTIKQILQQSFSQTDKNRSIVKIPHLPQSSSLQINKQQSNNSNISSIISQPQQQDHIIISNPSRIVNIQEIISDSDDDSQDLIQKYYKNKHINNDTTSQQAYNQDTMINNVDKETNFESDQSDSVSSEQILSIIENLHKQKKWMNIDPSNN